MNYQLEIKNLSAGYQKGKPILEEFSLSLAAGERIGIVGQNGSGKSTLAKAIMGITPYIDGDIIWECKNISAYSIHEKNKLGISYFMQGGRVFGNLTVQENLTFALLNQKKYSLDTVIKELQVLDLALFGAKRMQLPSANLSGGERHILSFLMVVYSNPEMKILIADEPSAGIAIKVQKDLLKIINFTLEDKKISLLLIEQNLEFLNQLTKNIINISKK